MSYGTEAASAASDTGSAASSAASSGGAAAGTSSIGGLSGTGADLYSQISGSGASPSGAEGYQFGSSSPTMPQSGPTVDTANMQTYGTTDPTTMQKLLNYYDRMQKGGSQSLLETYKNWGNNPETYGSVLSKFSSMGGKGGGTAAAPITINNSNQQAENTYLKKRGY